MIRALINSYPRESVILLSALVTLCMTLVTKKFTNQNRMRELKGIQKACQLKMKDNKGNPQKISEINKEMMECSMELMKHSFRPLLITFLPLILFFWWIRGIYLETFLGTSWIWYYIITGIVSSIIFRKIFKVV
jgi:uncharacterized membrane protein (DUF106 family)